MEDKNHFLEAFVGLEDPSVMFDLVVWGSYVRGSLNGKIPVDEAREIYKRIVKAIKKKK